MVTVYELEYCQGVGSILDASEAAKFHQELWSTHAPMRLFKFHFTIQLVALTSKSIYILQLQAKDTQHAAGSASEAAYMNSGSLLWSPVLPMSHLLKNSFSHYGLLYLPREWV